MLSNSQVNKSNLHKCTNDKEQKKSRVKTIRLRLTGIQNVNQKLTSTLLRRLQR